MYVAWELPGLSSLGLFWYVLVFAVPKGRAAYAEGIKKEPLPDREAALNEVV
jgi:hypothetical protein